MTHAEPSVPDRLVTIYDTNDCSWTIDPDDEPQLRRACDAFKLRAEDERLVLTTPAGGVLNIYASDVVTWFITTAESRRLEKRISDAVERDRNGPGWQEQHA